MKRKSKEEYDQWKKDNPKAYSSSKKLNKKIALTFGVLFHVAWIAVLGWFLTGAHDYVKDMLINAF